MSGSAPAVLAEGLTKRFGEHTAVDSVSFSVERGEVFGFLGPNGCGKTTTIRMLCGILEPSGGTGSVLGLDCRRDSAAVKRVIGYMSQRFALYDELTVDENLAFYGSVYGLPAAEQAERAARFVELMGLTGMRGSHAAALGAGLRQRLSLGCATLHRPPVVFLDEPTSGVDPAARRDFWELIYRLATDGATVFVTTHYMDEAEYCNRLALMHEGKLVAIGTPDSLRAGVGGVALEITAAPGPSAVETLARIPGLLPPTPLGDSLRVYIPPTIAPGEVVARLTAAGVAIQSVEQVSPSLDDVFTVMLG